LVEAKLFAKHQVNNERQRNKTQCAVLIAASSMQPSRSTQGSGRNHASRLLWQQEVAENKLALSVHNSTINACYCNDAGIFRVE
jgi:hypothetical protein